MTEKFINVPSEPTDEMLEAGADAMSCIPCFPKDDAKAVWEAMLRVWDDSGMNANA